MPELQSHMTCGPGNFFFAGARLFVGSLEAAIFLFSRVARIPEGSEVRSIWTRGLCLLAVCTLLLMERRAAGDACSVL